jgi:hypothetical protein
MKLESHAYLQAANQKLKKMNRRRGDNFLPLLCIVIAILVFAVMAQELIL